ncbi:MAG: 6-bladed beta-propeller [Desulfuromonadales bacterium]
MHDGTLKFYRRSLIAVAGLAVVMLSGCASARLEASAWQDKSVDMVWPKAPEKARVRLLRVIDGPNSVLKSEKGMFGRIFEYLSGDNSEYPGFFTPHCMATDGGGTIYIADPSLGVVHKYDLAAHEVSYIFQADSKKLGSPVGVALDNSGNLYVSDAQLATVFKFDSKLRLISELDSQGRFRRPAGIAITSKGTKIVADMSANKLFLFSADDSFLSELPGSDFTEVLNMPSYVAIDKDDFVYVTDAMNFTIRVFDAQGKYVRSLGQVGDSPGSFARPKGVAVDSEGHLYVLDAIFGIFQIFNKQGQLLLYVGQEGVRPGEMMLPSGIFIDKDDRIYVADTFNHRLQVFQYLKEGEVK